jgi:hypothetical protein
MKKTDKILNELIRKIERNDRWCVINDAKPTLYMEGVNDTCTDLIKFIKDLKKDKK